MKITKMLVVLAVMATQLCAVETPKQYETRMKWFREARFGIFIHWGLYSIPGGVHWKNPRDTGHAEWYIETTKMPTSEYEKFADQFNPGKFDAEVWAQVAKDSGAKYICITSMHHDGFAMFPSKVSDRDHWSLSRTPFGKAGRDPLMELKKACERRGIKFCLYHTIMDWHSPLYGWRRDYNDVAAKSGIKPDMDKFQEYLEASVLEDIERYHPAMLWFDGNWEGCWTLERGKHLEAAIRKVDPNVIINNRIGKGSTGELSADMLGDYVTPEQFIPTQGYGKDVAFEACMTMSGHNYWGYNKADADQKSVKSTQTLLNFLIDLSSKGGNMLLNVGPTPEGEILPFYVEHLREMGAWLAVNGSAIYGTSAGPFKKLPFNGRCSQKDNKLFLHVFDWPATGQLLIPVNNQIKKAYLLAAPRRLLKTTRSEAGILVQGPVEAPDKYASVVVLELKGQPGVVTAQNSQSSDGAFCLTAERAALTGGLRIESASSGLANIGCWTDVKDSVEWMTKCTQPGKFDVEAEIACSRGSEGSEVVLQAGKRSLMAKIAATGTWGDFQTVKLGEIEMEKGTGSVVLKANSKPGVGVLNLRCMRLIPVK